MPVKLFTLRNVPEDEAEEIRALLSQHSIDYYETSAGSWGISMPAIWLSNEDQFERAKGLLQDYQHQRTTRMRQEYEQRLREGKVETLADRIKREPLRFILYVAIALAVLYFSTKPFLDLATP